MNGEQSIYGESLELEFDGKPIAALMVAGVPWFSLSDVCAALGEDEELADDPEFPSFAKMTAGQCAGPDDVEQPEDVVILSPVGVWYLTALMDEPAKGQGIAAWAKRETNKLCPTPVPGDRAVFLTILEVEGRKVLPPYPWKYSGRRSEFLDLRDSKEWLYRDCPELLLPRRAVPESQWQSEFAAIKLRHRQDVNQRVPGSRPLGLKVRQPT